MSESLTQIVSEFGVAAKQKLNSPAITGEPEDQLRNPLEILIGGLARLSGLQDGAVTLIGETLLTDSKTRPDFAVQVRKALCGFIEVKRPGKGADPRKFADKHDRAQWDRLKPLPNLIYTDGNAFSLWRNGELESLVALEGDVASSGKAMSAPPALLALFADFFSWAPIAPPNAKRLAETSARLCRLLREEVLEQLAAGHPSLTGLAKD